MAKKEEKKKKQNLPIYKQSVLNSVNIWAYHLQVTYLYFFSPLLHKINSNERVDKVFNPCRQDIMANM